MARRGESPGALALALALGTAATTGCSGTSPSSVDAALARDASVVDSTLASDSGATWDAPSADASAEDAGAAFCGGACDPSDARSCAGSSQVCRVDAQGARCVDLADAGTAGLGAACSAQADCDPGLACFAQATGAPGQCLEPCCAAGAPCGPAQRCRGTAMLADGTTSPWHACLAPMTCDLAGVEHPCGMGEACYVVDDVGATECLIAGSAAPGQPCTIPSDCAPGSVCTGLTARTCVRVCFLASIEPRQGCDDGQRCQAQAYSPPGTGICTPAI
ncbi:MAG: hypothetical protein U0234_11930 [Sandaracinus sp.]